MSSTQNEIINSILQAIKNDNHNSYSSNTLAFFNAVNETNNMMNNNNKSCILD
jgi:hypothetical protein